MPRRINQKVLVFGATGKQGNHVAKHLLKRGHTVYAFTRHVESPAARELAEEGAEIVVGDFNDRLSIQRAVEEVDAVFEMTVPDVAGLGTEINWGETIADICKEKGKYLIFSSVANADKNTGIPHFESKFQIEKHIKNKNIEACIIAPVFFMENITMGLESLKQGKLALPLSADTNLTQIALDDLASFAVLALEQKDRFVGQRFDIASDELSGAQCTKILSRVIEKPIQYSQVPIENVRKTSPDMAIMFEWFENVGFDINIKSLHKNFPEVKWNNFESWAQKQKWKQLLGEARELKRKAG